MPAAHCYLSAGASGPHGHLSQLTTPLLDAHMDTPVASSASHAACPAGVLHDAALPRTTTTARAPASATVLPATFTSNPHTHFPAVSTATPYCQGICLLRLAHARRIQAHTIIA